MQKCVIKVQNLYNCSSRIMKLVFAFAMVFALAVVSFAAPNPSTEADPHWVTMVTFPQKGE